MKRIFYVFAIIMALIACEDDESFSTSSGLRLTFSADTLKMDTVFSRMPSSTYSFWVHNRNDDGIRIATVKLKRGNQTGFRVNVDGVYLDNSNGSQTSNLEIRRKDSVLVFVELTAVETRQKEPALVEDDLLFSLENGAEQRVCLRAWAWDALKLYEPVIEKDSMIESELPVVVYGGMTVNKGVTLTIRNTTLYFHDGAGMEIAGRLVTENCLLRGDRLDDMFYYLPYDRVSGQWKGIHFLETSTDNELVRTQIRNPQDGIVCDSAAFDNEHYRLTMRECVVHNCEGMGVKTVNANICLENCQLTNTLGNCLAVCGGMAKVSYCTLAQFFPFSADRGAALFFTNLPTALWGFDCQGTIVTGYEEDVVEGVVGSEELTFDYHFRNCLLRTVSEGADTTAFDQIIWETPKDSIQGKQHFVKIDEEYLDYDFHLDSLSTAQGLGCYRENSVNDRGIR